jgi:hypothetical protein
MNGYLQRLLDTAAPVSEPPALTPVVKSTSPIFEQNQLPGLAGLYAEESELESAPQVVDAPVAGVERAPTPLPPAAAPAMPPLETIRRDPLPVMPTPSLRPAVGHPAAEIPLPTLRPIVDATPPQPQEPQDTARQPARPDPEIVEPSLRVETVVHTEPERGGNVPATLEPGKTVFAPAPSERVASGTAPEIGPRIVLQPEEREALPVAVSLDELRAPAPSKSLGNAPLGPVVLEPRPRPTFDYIDPHVDESRPELQQAPRITIGRATVALEPDLGPAVRPIRAPRTAATASVIGPLGNRRARRRLFALARL